MKQRNLYSGVSSSVLVSMVLGIAAAEEPQSLKHNPFSRPPSERTVWEPDAGLNTDSGGPVIDLRATMVATNDRLANIGGRILRPGDDVQGYSLLQVFEDRAIFLREGKQLTIYVKPERTDDEERKR